METRKAKEIVEAAFNPLSIRLNELQSTKGKATEEYANKGYRIENIRNSFPYAPEYCLNLATVSLSQIEKLYDYLDQDLPNLKPMLSNTIFDEVSFNNWEEQLLSELNFYKTSLEVIIQDLFLIDELKLSVPHGLPIETSLTAEELAGLFGLMERVGLMSFTNTNKLAFLRLLPEVFSSKSGAKSINNYKNNFYNIKDTTAASLKTILLEMITEAERVEEEDLKKGIT